MVTINITGGPTFQFPFQAGMNGQTALETAYNSPANNKSLTFLLQYYGSQLGYLVDMINGTYDSFISTYTPYFFWEFIVNGEPQNKGIDNTPINDGDVITFTYTTYDAATHTNTTLKAKFDAKSA